MLFNVEDGSTLKIPHNVQINLKMNANFEFQAILIDLNKFIFINSKFEFCFFIKKTFKTLAGGLGNDWLTA